MTTYLGQMYLTKLEVKDTTESNTSSSYLDLLKSIGRDGHFALPLTTSMTISISIFKPLATSNLRPAMSSDFPISFSDRDLSLNV